MPSGSPYSPEERERGLAALVIAGNSVKASEITGIPETTLRDWKREHRERYEQLRHELEGQVARTIAAEAESIAQRIAGLEHQTIDRIEATLDDLKPAEASAALRNLSTSKALQIDKLSSPLRERPSHVQASTGVEELVGKLNRMLGFDAVSTAVEIVQNEESPHNGGPSPARLNAG